MRKLRFASSIVDITPAVPVRLAGYANRVGPYEQVYDAIQAQVMFLEQGEERVLLIGADLLWWDRSLVEELSSELGQALGMDADSVIFTATHNHSGPGTGNDFLPTLESADEGYVTDLRAKLFAAAVALPAQAVDVSLELWQGDVPMNVYRRLEVDGHILMAPNFAVPIDQRASVLGFLAEDGSHLAHLIHYHCHANVSAENALHGDYPSFTRARLAEQYPGSVNIFLQGATGDVRPIVLIGDRFARMGYREAEVFGNLFADRLLALMAGDGKVVEPSLKVRQTSVALPLEVKYSEDELRSLMPEMPEEQQIWARKILDWPNSGYAERILDIRSVQLAESLRLLTLNAEIVQAYAAHASAVLEGTLTCGYTNGMIGYLCTADQIAEGGYEPDESGYWFALAGPYSAEIESLMKEAIEGVLEQT